MFPSIRGYVKEMGGPAAVGEACGVPDTTVNVWVFRDQVGRKSITKFLRHAKKKGVKVDTEFVISGSNPLGE